jgi:hypothetical protein
MNSPKSNNPIYNNDENTHPISINMNFLSDTDEEIIPPTPVEAEKKSRLLLQLHLQKEKEEGLEKMKHTWNKPHQQNQKSKITKIKLPYKGKSMMKKKDGKLQKT